jgi:serine protein kinase
MYASAAERILDAIGQPEMVDTARDARLGRVFMNLQALGKRRLTAADGAEQVEDLLALLQSLRRVAEERDVSPVFESPLGLFDPEAMGREIEERFGIPRRRLTGLMSPWALKRLDEAAP